MELHFILLIFVSVLDLILCRSNNMVKRNPSDSIEYYTTTNQNLTIRVVIHIDKILTDKLTTEYGPKTRQKLKSKMKEIVTEVENYFKHPSLNQKINFMLIDTKFLKNKTSVVAMDDNVTKYLKSYCNWQGDKKTDRWYFSVLLTGLDLYYINSNGTKVIKSTGRGFQGGLCSVRYSCALLEWHPINTGYLLAHEIAHSLDVPHDGPPNNECRREGHMMGAQYQRKRHPKTWSPCSRRALKTRLTSKTTWCLRTGYENKLNLIRAKLVP